MNLFTLLPGLLKKTTYQTSWKVTSLITSQWCHG